ncbi:MAG: acyl-CoA dehydrogenase family protein [Actinomycetota bacterium]
MVSTPNGNSKPNALDFLDIDGLLTDEERMIRETVRRFVQHRVLPEIGVWFERGVFPRELIKEMAGLGLLGMHLTGYGCAGTSAVEYGLACIELEAGDSGMRSFVSVQGSLAMFAIWRFGSESQKETWLPPMAEGEKIGCFGLTEPDAGSDPGSMRTSARRDGDDWVLSGAKMWITNGNLADVAIVWARTEEGIRGFLVPTDTPGFTARETEGKLSLRASVTSELILDDCRLPADSILPEANGLRAALACLDEARYGIAWGVVGAARACYEAALSYAATRTQFGSPIAGFQLIQSQLVGMLLSVNRGHLLALHLGRLKDAGKLSSEQISFGKLSNVRDAREAARLARSVLGANGITIEYPVMRHMNNLESVYTYEGTDEIHTLILGQAITGISAFRSS